MFALTAKVLCCFLFVAAIAFLLNANAGCGKQPETTIASNETNVEPSPSVADEAPPATDAEPVDPSVVERIKKEKWAGDLNGMVQRRFIRALVTYNRTYYFYDGANARGMAYEALKEFEKFVNQKLSTGRQPVSIIFIPVQRGELLPALVEGRGDIAVSNIAIVPEAQQVIDYSDPVRREAANVVVTGQSAPQIASVEDLSGQEIYVRKRSRYWLALTRLNEEFAHAGKPPVILKAADEQLEDEDVLEMVNAGLVGMTLADQMTADLWAKVFPSVTVHADVIVGPKVSIGWAFRKNSPEFAALVNEFVNDPRGPAYSNILIKRYFKDTRWIENATSGDERKKFLDTVSLFKKYSEQYGFDWLMVAAQAYQESRLDQNARSQAGAVGVMQIKPSTAAGSPINISNVDTIEPNIHAGVKYMRYMIDRYFKDAHMNKIDKGLFAFASYNAGPARVAKLRKAAKEEKLDPDKWFNNVELIAGREIGPETVNYVSNIYKYYVAFKLVQETELKKRSAKKS